jgi:hypothetical protein
MSWMIFSIVILLALVVLPYFAIRNQWWRNINPTMIKYIGAVAIAAGWFGLPPEHMGRDVAIPLIVVGIVLFANGLKSEIIEALHTNEEQEHRET